MKRKTFLSLLYLFLFSLSLFATSAASIYFASESDLLNMIKVRGLEEGSREEMMRALYEYEGLEEYREERSGEGGDLSVSILNAENITASGSSVIINGQSSLSLFINGEEAIIGADTIVIDTERSTVTALDKVYYNSKEQNAQIQDIEADIVTLKFDSGEFKISNGATFTERENSEGENITFYTSGETFTYSPGGQILYEKGVIATRRDEPHSSINAANIAMLSGSDLFVSNVYLSIGRIPVLWLPFFFLPGSQVVGNPSIGFTSDKGMFLNTTFEIFGKYSKIENNSSSLSFTSLFSEEENGETYPLSSYYGNRELNKVEKWAERTDSYLAVIGDAYSEGGINFGFDANINLFDKKLKISLFNGIAISESNTSYGYGNFRYYGINSITYAQYGFDLKLSVPYYSDSRVMMDYANRVYGFSIMSLVDPPDFPTTYSSSVSQFDRSLAFSYTLPSQYKNDYITSFSISSLNADLDYRWNSTEKEYYIKEAVLPSFVATLSGQIFGFDGTLGSIVEVVKEEDDITDRYLLSDPLLYDLYRKSEKAVREKNDETYSVSLKYTISENLSNNYVYNTDGSHSSSWFSSTSSLKLSFNAEVASYADLSIIFTPSYYYLYEDDNVTTVLTEKGAVGTDLTFAVPYIGLEYRMAARLVNVNTVTTDGIVDRTYLDFGWNDDTIISHYIGFSKSFVTKAGTFTPKFRYYIPPLSSSMSAGLGYLYSYFGLSFEWNFVQDELSGIYNSDDIYLSLSVDSPYVTFSLSLGYESEDFTGSDFFYPLYGTSSFSLRSKNKKWSITEYIDYDYFTDGNYNYFNNLTTTFKIPYFTLSLDWAGPASLLSFQSVEATLDLDTVKFQLWKGRLYFAFGFNASFYMEMDNPYGASLELEPSITFSIAEFLDFTFSFSSINNSFYEYYENDKFSFSLLFSDLLRSFDFFGSGRYNTAFVFSQASLLITHYMQDWNLNVRYSAVVSLVDDKYQFIPEFTIYISWKTISELNLNQSYKERNGVWTKN